MRPLVGLSCAALGVLLLTLAACVGDGGPAPGTVGDGAAIHPELRDLRDAVSRLAGEWTRRDGRSPPTLDGNGLHARDVAIARLSDRMIVSDVLYLDDGAAWSTDSSVAHPPAGLDNGMFTPIGEERGAALGMFTARWTSDPGHATALRLEWGAWLEESRFGVVRDDNLLEEHGNRYAALHAYSDGRATQGLQEGGGASYRGVALAHRTSSLASYSELALRAAGRPLDGLLLGRATIDANFGFGTVDVAVHDLVELATGAPAGDVGATWRSIGISHETMSFTNGRSSLTMSFYGRNGAEIGGVFRTEDMVGAFGAARAASDLAGAPPDIVVIRDAARQQPQEE